MERSAQLARHRAIESANNAHKLFADPYADALASQVEHRGNNAPDRTAHDILATKFLDDMALQAVGLVNMDLGQEYRQVVLLGDGMDTRPYRLPWPAGTVLYVVAPPEVHDRAEAVLEQQGARVLRGCLVKRVHVDLKVWAARLLVFVIMFYYYVLHSSETTFQPCCTTTSTMHRRGCVPHQRSQ